MARKGTDPRDREASTGSGGRSQISESYRQVWEKTAVYLSEDLGWIYCFIQQILEPNIQKINSAKQVRYPQTPQEEGC